jgi:hypothetical protein
MGAAASVAERAQGAMSAGMNFVSSGIETIRDRLPGR